MVMYLKDMKWFFILLILCSQVQAVSKKELHKINNLLEIKQLKLKIQNKEELRFLNKGILEISNNVEKKLKNYNSIILTEIYGNQISFWTDCFFTIWGIDGISVSKSIRNHIIDTPLKKERNLYSDRVFGGRILKIQSNSVDQCLNVMHK